jgi:hypothetical protein
MFKPAVSLFKPVFYFILVVSAFSCIKHENTPQLTNLSKLKQTEFVPTLENDLNENKNVIYASAFLYAWDGVKHLFKSPIITADANSKDFKLINNSNSFRNSLDKNEYEAEASMTDGQIESKAVFNLALPFPSKLQKLNDGILFEKKQVSAFGMSYLDSSITKFAKILFYKDDDNFIIKLMPKDTAHEVILIEGLKNIRTFADAINQTNSLIAKGDREKNSANDSWKYEFNPEDSFSIPMIKFNIETNYKSIEGQSFKRNGIRPTVQKAYQRTSLILDENGAIIKSAGDVSISSDSVGAPPKIHPKNMIFDKSFFIIIKRVGKTNPYFLMKVENAELLTEKK